MDQIDRSIRQQGRRGGGGSNAALTTLAKESFDILTLLPNYIESTKTAVSELKQDTQVRTFVFLLSAKLYIPSTLNIDLILWHPQSIVDAVKC